MLSTLRIATLLLLAAGLSGCGTGAGDPAAQRDSAQVVHLHGGISIAVPRSWHVARRTTALSYPAERVTFMWMPAAAFTRCPLRCPAVPIPA